MKTNRRTLAPLLSCGLMAASTGTFAQDHDHATHRHHAPEAPLQQTRDTDRSNRHASATPTEDMGRPHEPIPVPTDADREAAFPQLSHHMEHAPDVNWRVLFNRLEAHDGAHGTGQSWEGAAWIGGDTDRLWLRSEGERNDGATESADLELLYGRSVSRWWDVVAGIRHDFKPGDAQTWLAAGIQGMAPYRFEVSATLYAGESGRTAAALEIEYDMLLTNRLILQPLLEAEFHGQHDPARGIGTGLSTVEAGLRLRYELTRRFAPYAGYAWSRAYGDTADLRRTNGESIRSHGWVAGIRAWF